MMLPFMLYAADSASGQLQLRAEQWEIERHGERLIRINALKNLVDRWSSRKNQKIELQYPGGEEGELWVQELMDWLISLGIPSQYMVTVPGSGAEDIIRFKILKVGDKK